MNNDKLIELKFGKADTRLAGNPYGKTVYNEQVKDVIDFERMNVIIFPDSIEKIASSFVQGFFSDIVANIGYDELHNKITLRTRDELVTENMWKDLFA